MSSNEIDEELEANVAALTIEEAKGELLECARYDEFECVDALLRHFGKTTKTSNDTSEGNENGTAFIDTVDSGGSTALHKAACNGHIRIVKLLIDNGARHLPNLSGNTPLHWASRENHVDVVKVLLERYSESGIDVLQKNKFGKSALTEGFSFGHKSDCNERNKGKNDEESLTDVEKTKTVGTLLEHDTACEDRLIGNSVQNEAASEESQGVTHELALLCDDYNTKEHATLLVRELPIAHADNPFGDHDDPSDDTTGLGIWCASLVMARWLVNKDMCKRFSGKILCELGAGCGVPGLACSFYAALQGFEPPKKVFLTDLNEGTMKNLTHNIKLNSGRCPGVSIECWESSIEALRMDWSDKSTWPTACHDIDYVIGSDLIYQKEIVPFLITIVKGLLNRGNKVGPKSFLYVAPDTGRDGLPEFIKGMKKEGFRCISDTLAPDEYVCNPLSNKDEDECFLHFGELRSTTYILYEFLKK